MGRSGHFTVFVSVFLFHQFHHFHSFLCFRFGSLVPASVFRFQLWVVWHFLLAHFTQQTFSSHHEQILVLPSSAPSAPSPTPGLAIPTTGHSWGTDVWIVNANLHGLLPRA
jgi:hypothetical protein